MRKASYTPRQMSGTVSPLVACEITDEELLSSPSNRPRTISQLMDEPVDVIPVERLNNDLDTIKDNVGDDIGAFLSRLITQLDGQRVSSDKVMADLLSNKTEIADAHAQAARALSTVKTVVGRVDRIEWKHQSLDDKLERERRMKDVVIRGVPLVGRESPQHLKDVVFRIAEFINCPLVPREIDLYWAP